MSNLQDLFESSDSRNFRKQSEETKKKISEARKNRSPEIDQQVGQKLKGRRQSNEHIENAKIARQKVIVSRNARTTPQKCSGNSQRNAVKVHTPQGTFNSLKAAAEHYKVSPKTFTYWLYVSKTDQFTAECQ